MAVSFKTYRQLEIDYTFFDSDLNNRLNSIETFKIFSNILQSFIHNNVIFSFITQKKFMLQ